MKKPTGSRLLVTYDALGRKQRGVGQSVRRRVCIRSAPTKPSARGIVQGRRKIALNTLSPIELEDAERVLEEICAEEVIVELEFAACLRRGEAEPKVASSEVARTTESVIVAVCWRSRRVEVQEGQQTFLDSDEHFFLSSDVI